MRGLFSLRALIARSQSRPHPLSVGIAAVTLTALYLALPARDSMNGAAAAAVLLHIGLGLALAFPAGIVLHRLYQESRSGGPGRRNLILSVGLMALLCVLTGGFLTVRAASGHSAVHDSWATTCHIIAGLLALLPVGVSIVQAALRKTQNLIGGDTRFATLPRLSLLLLLLILSQGALWGAAALLPDYDADGYYRDLTATNAEQAENPLFPAGLRLHASDGTELKTPVAWSLPPSSSCGRAGCHAEAFYQWQASGHHLAGTDVVYRSVLQQAAARSGRQSTQWCQGCHAPHAVIASSDAGAVQTSEGEGVGCYACHAAVGTQARSGNAHYALAEPRDYPFDNTPGWEGTLHDFLLRVRPGPHQRAYLKPEIHSSSDFCANCHRQSFSVAQNKYQFVRGPDEFGEWQAGPFSRRSARSSQRSVQPDRTCQSCHFTEQPTGHVSHDSLGGNTALPALLGDKNRQAQTEAYLHEKISLDLFALHRTRDANQGEEWVAPLDNPLAPAAIHAGETWMLDVLISNRGVGHSFPSGYTDIKEAWLEVQIAEQSGHILLENGLLPAPASALPPDAHAFTSLGLDRTGNPVAKHNITEQITTVYRRVIAPGSSDVVRYRFTLPRGLNGAKSLLGPLQLTVRLRYRSLRPDFVGWVLKAASTGDRETAAGFIPPITTLAETTVTLPVNRPAEAANRKSAAENLEKSRRFVRYGRALLAPGERPDLSRALRAFRTANELAPDQSDPFLGIGQVFLKEPDMRLAAANFMMALNKDPGNNAAAADLSVVYNKQGQHDLAIQTLKPLLLRFPQDGNLQFDFGLALFKSGRYEQAAEAFQHALAADPDDAAAHFQLKRCYEVMRKVSDARREDSITRYLAEDKLAPLLVPRYLASHPDARQSAQPFPVHILHPFIHAPE